MSKPSDYFSREARLQRRASRLAQFDRLANNVTADKKKKLTSQTAGVNAVSMVADILDNYRLPSNPKLGYSGVRAARTADNTNTIESGVVTIHAEFRSRSGVNIGIDIPVEIHEGELLEPSVFLHDGFPKVFAQSSFDNLTADNTLYEDRPLRDLYSSPMNKEMDKWSRENRMRTERVNTGMFSIEGARESIRRAISLGTDVPLDPRLAQKDPREQAREEEERREWEQSKKLPTTQLGLPSTTLPGWEPWQEGNDEPTDPGSNPWSPDESTQKMHPGDFGPIPKGPSHGAPTKGPSQGKSLIRDESGVLAPTKPQKGQHWPNNPYSHVPNARPSGIPVLTDIPQRKIPTLDTSEFDFTDPKGTQQIDMNKALDKTQPSMPWDDKTSAVEDYDADDKHEKPDHDRNKQDDDYLDPAERHQSDLHAGKETSLSEAMEVKERGGVAHDLPKGTKCTILRDHAGDNKSFVVRFDNGLEAIVERHFLKSSAKTPKMPKQPKTPKLPGPKKQKKHCPKCNMSPCVCHKKKSQARDFLSKVNEELNQLRDDGLGDIDCKMAILSKYGKDVHDAVFLDDIGPAIRKVRLSRIGSDE